MKEPKKGRSGSRKSRNGKAFFAARRGDSSGTQPFFQTKLRIGPAGDRFEQEADRVAEAVVSSGAAPMVQRVPAVDAAREDEDREIQRQPLAEEDRSDGVLPGTDTQVARKALPAAPAGPGKPAPRGLASEVSSLSGSGRKLPDASRAFFEGSFGVGFDQVRVHTDERAARLAGSVDARAFAHGSDIVFGRGEYRPGSTEGKKLLAHELTHVVQQSGGASGSVIQRRRVPGVIPTIDLIWRENAAAHAAGLREIVRRAWADLTPAEKTRVRRRAMGGFTLNEAAALSQADRDLFFAHAIRIEVPRLEHGDPSLYQVGARTGTPDAANITTLVGNANTEFAAIAAGTHDASIGQVFGTSNVRTAKARYASARTRMNTLKGRDKIVTDRSGYSGEVGLGGLTNASQIMVSKGSIDNPNAKGSVVTMIHEAMHAGNPGVVTDRGYIHRADFTRMPETRKLTNAAHYEVVPRRALVTANFTFAGQTFTPAGGTTSAGTVTPTLTPREQAVDAAAETFRKAWTVGLNLHNLFVEAFRNPADWNAAVTGRLGVAAGTSFADSLPFWSKVEKLTVHAKTNIDPASSDISEHPFSVIDIALSEGVVRKLNSGMDETPQTAAAALALENAHATAAQRTAAAASVSAETNLLLDLVLRHKVGRITGGTSRDLRVVKRLAQAQTGDFSDMIANRPPSAFP